MEKLYGVNKLWKEVKELPEYPYTRGHVACFCNIEKHEVWGYFVASQNQKYVFDTDSENRFLCYISNYMPYYEYKTFIIKKFDEVSENYYSMKRMREEIEANL